MADVLDRSMARAAAGAELLEADVETDLARAWRDHRDETALHRLITAYMRLAVSMASKFRNYGVPMPDLIQEANLGLMKAADKFDPERGVRFSTYAMWWIKASIQDHVMRDWSLVRTGSTSSQKSLFFNLKRVEAQVRREMLANDETPDNVTVRARVAQELGVKESDVEMMQGRLSGSDFSLDAPQGGEEDGRAWVESLEDEAQGQEQFEVHHDEIALRSWLSEAMGYLNEREKYILRERRLRADPRTLADLGRELGLSKERVRQLEAAAFAKMRNDLSAHGEEIELFLR